MIRHGYECPAGWQHLKLKAEPHKLWSIVHALAGVSYGPLALAALGLPPQPTSGLSRTDAEELGAVMEAALSGRSLPEKLPRKARKKKA